MVFLPDPTLLSLVDEISNHLTMIKITHPPIKISVVLGTRPEAIKLAPVILKMKSHIEILCHVCVTAQHREMLDQILAIFDITPDVDLNIMKASQTLTDLTSRALVGVDRYLRRERPDLVLVQGDTSTVFATALAAFYNRIPVGHVEAGLRTWNLRSPWPEEANRVLVSRIADLHFAPTERSKRNLLAEGIPGERVFITGNTIVDALFLAVEKIEKKTPRIPDASRLAPYLKGDNPLVLITGHRRENFGQGFDAICQAIAELARRFPEVQFVYPVHLNPNVQEPVMRILGGNSKRHSILDNIHLLKPLSYLPFIYLMKKAKLLLTDSGGVQEEAPSLGKPVLVLRDTTERPEGIEAGAVKLVGTNYQRIVDEVSILLTDMSAYEAMAHAVNLYGDGKASIRVLKKCVEFLRGDRNAQ